MVVKHKKQIIAKMHKAIDRFADEIADKVVHELRESKAEERKEYRHHPKNCKCAVHRKHHTKR